MPIAQNRAMGMQLQDILKSYDFEAILCRFTLEALLHEEEDEVFDAVGVAPLVVVPADDLAGVADDLGQLGVDDGGEGVALEVGGDQLFVGVAEVGLQGAVGGGLEGGVDALDVDGLLGDEGEIDDRDVGGGDTHGEAVELAVHLGDDEPEGLGGAGGARNHGESSGTGAAEVLVGGVEDDLIVGVAVDRGHDAVDDAEGVVEDLDDGREAVGGAGGVGDDVVLGRVVLGVVDAEDEGEVLVGGRGGDDDLLDGGAKVGLGLLGVGEEAGGLHDDLGAYGGPVELGGVALGEDFDLLAVYGDEVGSMGDLLLEIAEDGVVLEQVGEGRGGGEIVYGYEFDIGVTKGGAENVASDAAEAVDAYLYCHKSDCSCLFVRYLSIVNGVRRQRGTGRGSDGRGAEICDRVRGCVTSDVCANCANGCAKK